MCVVAPPWWVRPMPVTCKPDCATVMHTDVRGAVSSQGNESSIWAHIATITKRPLLHSMQNYMRDAHTSSRRYENMRAHARTDQIRMCTLGAVAVLYEQAHMPPYTHAQMHAQGGLGGTLLYIIQMTLSFISTAVDFSNMFCRSTPGIVGPHLSMMNNQFPRAKVAQGSPSFCHRTKGKSQQCIHQYRGSLT